MLLSTSTAGGAGAMLSLVLPLAVFFLFEQSDVFYFSFAERHRCQLSGHDNYAQKYGYNLSFHTCSAIKKTSGSVFFGCECFHCLIFFLHRKRKDISFWLLV